MSEKLQVISDSEKFFILSKIWSEIKFNSANIDKFGIDKLDAAYQEAISKLPDARDFYTYFNILRNFVSVTDDSHTSLWLDQEVMEYTLANPPLRLIEAEGNVYVRSVCRQLANKIPPGSRVLSVDGKDIEMYIHTNVLPLIFSAPFNKFRCAMNAALEGPPNTNIELCYMTPSLEKFTVDIPRLKNSELKKIEMSSIYLPWESQPFVSKSMNSDILYLALNSFEDNQVTKSFVNSLSRIKKAKSLIIDLRFNMGGNSAVGFEILRYFVKKKTKVAITRWVEYVAREKSDEQQSNISRKQGGRRWIEKFEYILPKQPFINKPVVILFGRNTASAAEDFVAATKNLHMVTSIGEQTNGGTGQPLVFALGHGINFRVVTNQTLTTHYENYSITGLAPDILVERRMEDLVNSRDAVLERAISHLTNSNG